MSPNDTPPPKPATTKYQKTQSYSDSPNTKPCYYNNYSLTQPIIFAWHVRDIGQKVGLCTMSLLAVDAERIKRWSHQGSHVIPKTLAPLFQNLVASNSFILFLFPWTFTLEGYPSLGFTIIILQPLTTISSLLETLLMLLHVSTLTLLLELPYHILLLLSIITLFLQWCNPRYDFSERS